MPRMKKRLLVIDDDPDILKVLKANLSLYGFDAETASDWASARAILDLHLPDLIILDLTLPDGDGVDLCKILKERYASPPIIMLTARDSVPDKVLGLESGADDYIVKPFDTIELIARIKACLRRTEPCVNKIIIDDLEIDAGARIVKRGGRDIEFTRKEFDLLCLLVSNRGEVLSRELIRKKLWGDSKLYSWSRAIDVHIQHLRHKIEKDPAEPQLILTVPGVGYRFRY